MQRPVVGFCIEPGGHETIRGAAGARGSARARGARATGTPNAAARGGRGAGPRLCVVRRRAAAGAGRGGSSYSGMLPAAARFRARLPVMRIQRNVRGLRIVPGGHDIPYSHSGYFSVCSEQGGMGNCECTGRGPPPTQEEDADRIRVGTRIPRANSGVAEPQHINYRILPVDGPLRTRSRPPPPKPKPGAEKPQIL